MIEISFYCSIEENAYLIHVKYMYITIEHSLPQKIGATRKSSIKTFDAIAMKLGQVKKQ